MPVNIKPRAKKKHGFINAKIAALIVIVVILVGTVGVVQLSIVNKPAFSGGKVLLITSMGNITIQLYDDMPITSGNFKSLADSGVYDGTLFSRVAYDFVVQGGDATPKGIDVPTIRDELPNKHSNVQWSVAMAKTESPNSATSQFFINLKDNSAQLDSNYSVFGMVIAGTNVVEKISKVEIIPQSSQTDGKPVDDITIISALIV